MGFMGTVNSLHIYGHNTTRHIRYRKWRWPRVCTGVCDRMDWCNDRHIEFQIAWWKYVSFYTCMHSKGKQLTLDFRLFAVQNRSFFQSVCVLGYCLAPVAGALIVCKVLLIAEQTKFIFFLRLLSTFAGFLWASYGKNIISVPFHSMLIFFLYFFPISAAYIFLGDSQPPNRKPLAVYPIVFFYFILSWLVISHSSI